MFKNISKYAWFSFLPFLLLGALTLILYVVGIIPMYYLISTLIGWILIAGLGVAIGYHRIFSHNTHPNLPLWKENIILFLGSMSGQGSSIAWSSIHKGYHHKFSDTDRDIHTPIKGFYHSFFGWTTAITENNPLINFKYAGHLLRKKNHIWFHHNNLQILWLVPIIIALVDWKLSLALCCLPTSLSLVQDNLVNVFGHLKAGIGYRNFETNDNSQNNFILGYLGWGQGWHNNHHHDPKSFDFGKGISNKWWEFDPCIIFKPFLGNPLK
jgi:stearoyl-CoA desaturase (delta-9 desaturase)